VEKDRIMSIAITQPARAPWAIVHHVRTILGIRRKPRLPKGLDRRQLQDAGISWELAGYGRGADVSMLPIVILESQR